MNILFDQNLSPHLVRLISDIYPASIHVRDVGLANADDRVLWDYAASHGLTIVTKDADLHQMSFLYGHPPKIVWIQRGNCSTNDIEAIQEIIMVMLSLFKMTQKARFLHSDNL